MRIGKPNTGSSPAAPPTIQQTQARNGALTDNEPAPALGPARPHSEAAVRLLPVGRQPVLPPQQRPLRLPTLPAQADMMQARWGSHGDYGIIALCPNSPQECFDLTVTAFNLSEEFRVPVMMMLDECVGHMTEKVVIPEAERIEVTPRRYTKLPPEEFHLFEPKANMVPDMVRAGDGYRFHVTGLTHDERGYPSMNVETQDRSVQI